MPRQGGSVGSRVVARTNAFEMRWARPEGNKGYVYHYDVIDPVNWDLGDRGIGHKKGTELLMRLQDVIRPDIFNPHGAYDGKKNFFSFHKYNFNSQEFRVPFVAVGRPNRPPKEVTIKMVFVKQIDVGTLGRLVQGDPNSVNPESDAATALNMLNLFVQSAPRMTEPRIHSAKSFFTPLNKRTGNKIRPLELWRGHFQSVRPSFDRIIVNVDTTIGVILPSRGLEQICGEFLDTRNLRDLKGANLGKLRLFLKGVRVEVDLPGHPGKRPKTIKDVVESVEKFTFDKGGEVITVGNHFTRAHNVTIRPGTLGVRLGTDGLFPITVCKTIQQLYKNRSSPDVVREALDFSPRDPSQRLATIEAGWQELQYDNSSFLIGAGIKINREALRVDGRILPTPKINFAGGDISLQRPGQWDVMRKKFVQPASMNPWIVVDLAGCDPQVLNTFIQDLVMAANEKGMNAAAPRNVERHPAHAHIPTVLTNAVGGNQVQLVMVILPESAPQPYRDVKRFGDITKGVATQCVKWSRKLAGDTQQKKANQYHNNLLLKINGKLGGINCVPVDDAMSYLKSKPTMIIGADVSHPGPGSHLPSISGLVSSIDPKLSKYTASIRVQDSRTEIISDLSEVFEIALKSFLSANKLLPRRIFIFRDGVSEGEFSIVRDKEMAAIKDVLAQGYGQDQTKWPEVNFIVVGKRHHFRFFPMDQQSTDSRGNNNMHAGFIVDQGIVHPVHADFYLQSQPGLKGTSRPSHYTILKNGSGLSPDHLQQIAYALCHCYARSTRSVKIPAPVYYADLVCRRAKFHFEDVVGNFEDASANSDEHQHTDYYKQHFNAINNALKDRMYFL